MSSVQDIALHLEMTPANVMKLIKEGVITKQDRGQYDLKAVRKEYIIYMRNRAGTQNNLDLAKERARLAKEQADAKEMENAVERGDLVYISEIVEEFKEQLMKCKTKLFAVPTKIAAEAHAAATVTEVQDLMHKAIEEATNELIGYRNKGAEG
jgi:phage terminase Nu1 subunit (DNA packaging protein)